MISYHFADAIVAEAREDPPAGPETTSVQIRLPDGKRVVKKFLKSDLVRTLFAHAKSIPELQTQRFEVISLFIDCNIDESTAHVRSGTAE